MSDDQNNIKHGDVSYDERVKKQTIGLAIVGAVLVLIMASVCGTLWYFKDRALPNTMLGSVNVGGKTRQEITKIAEEQIAKVSLIFEQGEKRVEAKPQDLGVHYDVSQTVEDAINSGRTFAELSKPWENRELGLYYTSDFGAAINFAKQNFPETVTDAKDAELIYNAEERKFTIKDGVPGQGFDLTEYSNSLQQVAKTPEPVALTVSTTVVEPAIKPDGLQGVQDEINKRLSLSLKFLYQGRLMYFAEPQDIAEITTITQDVDNKTVKFSYDAAKIEQFLRQKVSPSVASPPLDAKVLRNPETGTETVIQAGREGKQLANLEALAGEILGALESNQSVEKEVAVVTAPFKTVTLSGGGQNWVEVDLSEQRTTLWSGDTQVASFIISSGVAPFYTPTGEYAIWYKTPNQVMTGGSRASGDYYYLPNVTWVSYFYKDYGFHTAYWHNNFGTPMSHGCINMREADAKALYDFAPIGTKVIVHN
ncbi:MAG TPA: L,D-transpeptidase family protein [Candidatus Saccharimonadales bacterium]|nr:L,D-transpeptidase family protein [Candidatus Saccharimonadales bacterium]